MGRFNENRITLLSSTLSGSLGGIGIIKLGFKFFADKTIEFYKKEYQKNLQDYNLYSIKRNNIYSRMYELLQIAYGTIPCLNGAINYPERNENTNITEIYDFYENNPIIPDYTKRIMISKLKHILTEKNITRNNLKRIDNLYFSLIVEGSITEANNYYIINSIYLGNEIDEGIKEIIKILKKISYYTISRFKKEPIITSIEKENDLRDNLDIKIIQLKEEIKREIFGK